MYLVNQIIIISYSCQHNNNGKWNKTRKETCWFTFRYSCNVEVNYILSDYDKLHYNYICFWDGNSRNTHTHTCLFFLNNYINIILKTSVCFYFVKSCQNSEAHMCFSMKSLKHYWFSCCTKNFQLNYSFRQFTGLKLIYVSTNFFYHFIFIKRYFKCFYLEETQSKKSLWQNRIYMPIIMECAIQIRLKV